ncbi:MAG: DUF4198 domain-containing protein [Candidatus Saccharibacteria bacterium]|nr:DUF4198 domain-containing protein [Moraxellaceae bacterium]
MFGLNMSLRQSFALILIHVVVSASYAASPFLLPEQFDVDARTNSISIQSGIAGDYFYASSRNFKTEFAVTAPDGTTKNVPVLAELKKFSVLETDVSQRGTYAIQTVNTTVLPTRYALIDGQWLRVMQPRPMAGMKPEVKKESEEKKDGAKHDLAKAEPAKVATSILESKLPADAQVVVSNTLNQAVTYVTKGAPSPISDFIDKGFEVRPITHPSEAYVTDGVMIEARMDGKPLSGLTFNVLRGASQYDKDSKRERPDVVTDAQGRAKVIFDQTGVYLLSTSYPATNRDRAVQPPAQTVNFGLTIEVAQ